MIGTVDIGKVGIARSVHVQSAASPHVIRSYIVCFSPYSHTSAWESVHIFTMARLRPFCTLSRFKLLQVDQGSSVPLTKSSFGMIPLSRHSVDRSPRVFHASTHNVVRSTPYDHLVLRCVTYHWSRTGPPYRRKYDLQNWDQLYGHYRCIPAMHSNEHRMLTVLDILGRRYVS